MKKIIHIAFVNIFVVIALFTLSEISVRHFLPQIKLPGTESKLLKDSVYFSSPGLVPNSQGLSNGTIKFVDNLGFWKYAKSNKKVSNKWLFLGDSVTMGIGIEPDSTFAGILCNKLPNVTIYNSSIIGYSSNDYLNIIKKILVENKNSLNISSVFVFWCLNDIYSNSLLDESPGFNSDDLFDNIIVFLRNNFKLYHLLKNLFSDRSKIYYLYDNQFYNNENSNFQKSINDLVEINQIIKKQKIEMFVILLPYEYQLREKVDLSSIPQNIMEKALFNNGIKYYNLMDEFSKYSYDTSILYLYGDGIHFSNFGHKIVSRSFMKQFIN